MSPKPHAALRGAMLAQGVEQAYLAVKLRRSARYVGERISGREPWTQAEMYKTMDLLSLPHDQLHIYFPPGGIHEKLRVDRSRPKDPERYVLVPEKELASRFA